MGSPEDAARPRAGALAGVFVHRLPDRRSGPSGTRRPSTPAYKGHEGAGHRALRSSRRFAEALALERRRLELGPTSHGALRDPAVSLNSVGDTDLALGDIAAARAAYQETLPLRRRLLDLYGDNPQALRALAIIQEKLEALDAAKIAE